MPESEDKEKLFQNVNVRHKESLTRLERFAVWVTDRIGTMGFFFLIFAWTMLWFLWNTIGPKEFRFDPFPAFALWLFISNMLQLFFLPLIMVGQNLQSRHAELRAEHDFEINQKAEREIEAISAKLGEQKKILSEVLDKLDRR
ncbi:DUF1003 domain-containing protein [Candidatus Wolfebacteria bacterium]|nr:DUF1003 domain-containing protein [Candidatus Wolfebacteria bacterium]